MVKKNERVIGTTEAEEPPTHSSIDSSPAISSNASDSSALDRWRTQIPIHMYQITVHRLMGFDQVHQISMQYIVNGQWLGRQASFITFQLNAAPFEPMKMISIALTFDTVNRDHRRVLSIPWVSPRNEFARRDDKNCMICFRGWPCFASDGDKPSESIMRKAKFYAKENKYSKAGLPWTIDFGLVLIHGGAKWMHNVEVRSAHKTLFADISKQQTSYVTERLYDPKITYDLCNTPFDSLPPSADFSEKLVQRQMVAGFRPIQVP